MSERKPMNLAVLASGRGSNMRALLEAGRRGLLPFARFVAVVSNNPDAAALDSAREHGIPAFAIDHRPFRKDREKHEAAIIEALRGVGAEGLVLAGYMRLLTPVLLDAFAGRIINIHPSLLPSFPGVDAQHQAHAYGVRWSGCTVHFVTREMDAGPIILQRIVPVRQADSADALAHRILEEEHRAFPLAVDLWTRGRLLVDGRRVVILRGPGSFPELEAGLDATTPLLVATGNMHKVEEIGEILSGTPIRLISTRAFPGTPEPEENADSYAGNALIKASDWSRRTGLWALADDSGLEVDALGGRPGIYSSRYAATASERNAKLLGELAGVPPEKRTARFVCHVVLTGPDGSVAEARGTCEGHIGFEPRGDGGFGYDPIFVPDGFDGRHLAELPADVKNRISHRSNALRGLLPALERWAAVHGGGAANQ